jgi:hypothetical protein
VAIIKTEWRFGDGTVSSDLAPLKQYPPGKYTVTLIATLDTGLTYEVEKIFYIKVDETNQSLLTEDYAKFPKCLHYDWDYGWSEYGGEHWVWPATPASIAQSESGDVINTLAWDIKDNKRYVLNTRDTYSSEAIYKDKDTYPIETSITLPEFTGELQKYDVSHLETYLRFRPELLESDLPVDFDVDVALITDSKEEPVETSKSVDTSREVTFYYQNQQTEHTQTRQLRIDTSESMYQLINYESFFKINNRFRTPSYGVVSDPQEYFGGAISWVTRGKGYKFNRVTLGSTFTTYDPIEGPDGEGDSAADLIIALGMLNDVVPSGCLSFWYKDTKPYLSPSFTPVDFGANGDWTLAYYNGALPANITFSSGDKVFDIRIMDSTATQDNLQTYFDQFDYYLPE